MSDYNKATNFSVKDTLTTGDPNKIVSGAEIDTEFDNIASSSSTKADKVSGATSGNLAQLNASGNLIDSGQSIGQVMPTGAVTAYAANSAPTGWLECNGSAVSRTGYADLFAALGTTFGGGDGSTTFNLPDLRGEFVRGWDNSRGVDSGRSFGSSQGFAIERITGTIDVPGFSAGGGFLLNVNNPFSYNPNGGASGSALVQDNGTGPADQLTYDNNLSATTSTETRPRNIALMYIIKT